MIEEILKIALMCIVIGGASIPVSFTVNSSPVVVWFGNALGSWLSVVVLLYIGNRITDTAFTNKISKWRMGKKIVTVYQEGDDNQKVQKARIVINNHGLRLFSFLCPIFPGTLISTVAVYALDLDRKIYKRWVYAGVIFASGLYVFGYWFFFVK